MAKSGKIRKLLIWLCLLTLFAGLVWAADKFLDAADSNAQAAASDGADFEMSNATVATTQPAKKTPQDTTDWNAVARLKKQLDANDKSYHSLLMKAGEEKRANNGAVSDATRQQGLDSAKQFNNISEQIAVTLEKGNCITKAKSVRATGKSRLSNAEMAFNSISSDRINEYNKQSGAMADANVEDLQEMKASGGDMGALKAQILPQLNKLVASNTKLMSQVAELLNQVRQAAGGDVSAMAGCAKGIVSGTAQDGPAGLLKPLMSLMDLIKGMGSNLATTIKAVSAL